MRSLSVPHVSPGNASVQRFAHVQLHFPRLVSDRRLHGKVISATVFIAPVNGCETMMQSTGSGTLGSFPARRPFFNRQVEGAKLLALVQTEPATISVVLGPSNAGKTALLKDTFADLAGTRCYLDMRMVDASTPAKLAQELLKLQLPWLLQQLPQSAARKFLKSTIVPILPFLTETVSMFSEKANVAGTELTMSGKTFSELLRSLLKLNLKDLSLSDAITAYTAVFKEYRNVPAEHRADLPWPVLVIDEANVLMKWSQLYPSDLDTLLRFFVGITTQEQQAHVVLASSDYALETWLSTDIGANKYTTYVVGEFCKQETEQFVKQLLSEPPTVADFEEIYRVCGGNAGALVSAARAYDVHVLAGTVDDEHGNWQAALRQVAATVHKDMAKALYTRDAGFTALDFSKAVQAILKSKFSAVAQADMVERLGGVDALNAMVQANVLALRPYSDWAGDIDVAAFDIDTDMLVTAPTAVHLHLMRKLRKKWLRPLQMQKQREKQLQRLPMQNKREKGLGLQ